MSKPEYMPVPHETWSRTPEETLRKCSTAFLKRLLENKKIADLPRSRIIKILAER